MKFWRPYGRVIRRLIRLALKNWRVTGPPCPAGPAVYIVHHQNLFGPVHAAALLPTDVRPWVLYPFCGRRDCFDQYYGYTFTKRFGWHPVLAAPAAGVLSLLVPPLMRSIGAVPVYRNGRRVMTTMDTSIKALSAGHSLLICPDRAYDDTSSHTGALYQGFLNLERGYRKTTGQHLAFVPVYPSPSKRALVTGEPLYFEGKGPFKAERAQTADRLAEVLNAAAQACGDL